MDYVSNSSSDDQIQFEDQDQEYIPIDLSDNDMENQKFIGEKLFINLQLSEPVKLYFKNQKKYTKEKFIELFGFKTNVDSEKSVCARSIQRGQTIVQCYDCATDNSCIQCMECFKNSNHQGHKVVIKKAYGGCCDCGDVQAWKKQGFCNKHSGELKDIQIDQQQIYNYLKHMKQLFFLIFWQSIQQNTNSCKSLSRSLLQNLVYLNQKGLYYNKLTCMMFESKISAELPVSKNINNRSILTNLLSPRVAKNIYIDSWMELFFNMFQYYPFKKLLLSTYMKGFSIIYDNDDQSAMRGTSISCQLLTSYQLVRQYALDKTSVPLGTLINIDNLRAFDTLYFTLIHDLKYITKLQGDTPQTYFKFHLTNKQALLRLFDYRKIIKKQQDKNIQQPPILHLARFTKYFQIQFKLLELLARVAGILQKDKETIAVVIKILYEEVLIEQNQKKMIIFKPLTRALTLFIFAYFDLDMEKMNHPELSKKFISQVVQTCIQQFGINLSKIFKICVQTYLFHSKILAQSGLNTTLYVYLYFYKIKTRFISSLDILAVKLFSMMHEWQQIKRQPVITPQDYIWSSTIGTTEQAEYEQLLRKTNHLQLVLSELNLISSSKSNQIYIAYQINRQCNLYTQYIQNILIKLLNQEKSNLSLKDVKQYSQAFFHPQIDLAGAYLKKFCTFDKTKKAFILKKQYQFNENQLESESLNYCDFRCNLTNKAQFLSPQKTLNIISNTYNTQVFDHLYSIQTIKKFLSKAIQLFKKVQTHKITLQKQQPNQIIQKFKPLFVQILKMIYLKRRITKNKSELNVVIEFINKVQNLKQVIHPFYHSLVYPELMEVQQKIEENLPERLNEKKSSLSSIQDEKKKKLRQKMQLKRKNIKQKYAKQLASFQQDEIIKLQQQQIKIQKQQQSHHKLSCIICKSQVQQNMVYLIKVSYKNHQKLLGLGQGVLCLSVMSCYHSIDYECYLKLQKTQSHKKRPTIKCPFCKFSTNTFLPVFATSKIVQDSLKRLQGVLFIQKNFDQISILEQIIKSFYHFSLLAHLDPQRTMQKRLKVYKIILQILKQNVQLFDIKKVYNKFIENQMNLNPQVFEQKQQSLKNQRLIQLRGLLLPYGGVETEELQQLQEAQFNNLWNLVQGNMQSQDSNSNSNDNQGTSIIQTTLNWLKKKKNQIVRSKKQNQNQSNENKYKNKPTKIFIETMRRLFTYLGFQDKYMLDEEQKQQKPQFSEFKKVKISETGYEKMELQHQKSSAQEDISPSVQYCIKKLFDGKLSQHHIHSIYQNLYDNNNFLKLRDLPLNFRPLGKINKCQHCKQITSSMTLCLLCDWKGCLKDCVKKNNKQLPAQGVTKHIHKHGQQSLFLTLSTCSVFFISYSRSYTIGCIYKDQWGNDFNTKQQWEKFFLDQEQLNKIRVGFLHDQ